MSLVSQDVSHVADFASIRFHRGGGVQANNYICNYNPLVSRLLPPSHWSPLQS